MLPLTPVYVVADVSGSMSKLPVGAINAELVAIAEDLDTRTIDALRLAVVSFDSTASTVLPLSDLGDVWEMPVLEGGGGTRFSAAFGHLARQLPDDLASLRSRGHQVDHPVIVMLTDGRPDTGDCWEAALEDLCAPGDVPSPWLLALGIGKGVDEEVLRRMVEGAGGKSCGFVAREGLPYLPVLPDLLRSIVGPLVSDIPAFRSLARART